MILGLIKLKYLTYRHCLGLSSILQIRLEPTSAHVVREWWEISPEIEIEWQENSALGASVLNMTKRTIKLDLIVLILSLGHHILVRYLGQFRLTFQVIIALVVAAAHASPFGGYALKTNRETSQSQCRCQLTPPCSIVRFENWWEDYGMQASESKNVVHVAWADGIQLASKKVE